MVMTTIKQLREWLKRFPEDTEVHFGFQQKPGHYESYGSICFESPVLEDTDSGNGWTFTDFRNNQFVKEADPFFGKYYLELGEKY
jgi:hypothetical protein